MALEAHRIPSPRIRQSDLSPEALELCKRYEDWMLACRGLGMKTIENRIGHFRRMTTALGLRPTPHQVEHHVADLRRSGASYGHVHATIMAAEDYMRFLENPIHLGRPRKPKLLLKQSLSETEIAMVLYQAQDLREKALIATLAYCGIRNQEFCGLKIGDVDLAECQISVQFGKGGHNYRAAFTGECGKLLGQYIQERRTAGAADGDWLFVTCRHGYQLETQDIRKIVKVAVRRAKVKKSVSPHLFRHSLAMNMLNRGANPMTIQRQLGHSNLETTLLYLRGEYTRANHEYAMTAPTYL